MPNAITTRQLWIRRKFDSDVPELVEAWDEYSIDSNYDGWTEACDHALSSIGSDLLDWRYVDVSIAGVYDAFEPLHVMAAVRA